MSHRALILGALASGTSHIHGLLEAEDTRATRQVLGLLGVDIEADATGDIHIQGLGFGALRPPDGPLDCGNSGTTMRLMAGVLAACGRGGTLCGDASLSRRPMGRIGAPLREMGAQMELSATETAPIIFSSSGPLVAQTHRLKVASGQLKGALLLAGLGAVGTTRLVGALLGRDHTERLLPAFGVTLATGPQEISLRGPQRPRAASIRIPGDISAAAFWLAAGALVPNSTITCLDVGINPSRRGFIDVLAEMGADVALQHKPPLGLEPTSDICVTHAPLKGIELPAHLVPSLIDELPLVALVATQAHGTTRVSGAAELRFKESDRLLAMAQGLGALGAKITLTDDGFEIVGPQKLVGAEVDSMGDHRIAMMLAVASLICAGTTALADASCIDVSYPGFWADFARVVPNRASHLV